MVVWSEDCSLPRGRVIRLISRQDCESKRADKRGPNVRKVVMQCLKVRHREQSKQETEVEKSRDGVCENGEGLGLIFIRDFESKRVDNGGPICVDLWCVA